MKSIVLATPTRNKLVTEEYHQSVLRLRNSLPGLGFDLFACMRKSADLVRTRSVLHHNFLLKTSADYLLWADDDSAFTPAAVVGMMQANVAFIGCPYPRKTDDEAPLVYYTGELDEIEISGDPPIAEVLGVGLGLAMMSRRCAEILSNAAFDLEQWFWHEGEKIPAPYMIKIDKDNELRTEDFAVCRLWREVLHGKVHLYCGNGSPIGHVGSKVYTASHSQLFQRE